MAGTLHIIGGGMAGLAAAVEAAGCGKRVVLHEAGRACGGRARSYEDRQLGCRIDNGNHMLLSANKTVFRYLAFTGGTDTLTGPGAPLFPFVDLAEDARWTLDLSRGKVPWWVFQPHKRVPDMRVVELRSLQNLIKAKGDTTVAECLLPGALTRRLLEPFAISALNTACETGSAALLGAVVRESLSQGGNACIPWYAKEGLSESLVDPALKHLGFMQVDVRTQSRIAGLDIERGRVTALHTPDGPLPLSADDAIILAVPAPVASSLLAGRVPGFSAPDEFESILNLHFRLNEAPQPLGSFAQSGFIGLVGSIAEWVFLRDDILSVTVSAANRFAAQDPDILARTIWHDVRRACDPVLKTALPATPAHQRVVWEKRATFAATPAQNRLRPGPATALVNLALAGDWTATGLPATLEGAMRSGVQAVYTLGLRRPT